MPADEEPGEHGVLGERGAVAAQQAQVPSLRPGDVGELRAEEGGGLPGVRGPDPGLVAGADVAVVRQQPGDRAAAWAPPWTGDQLRYSRAAARDARLAAVRAAAEAAAARTRHEYQEAARQEELAASYRAMHDLYRQHEAVFAASMTDREDWEQATRHQRQLAIAADAELRRRHPRQHWPPLRSAEPQLPSAGQPPGPAPAPENDLDQTARLLGDLAARHREFADQLAQRQTLLLPAEDPDYENLGPAFPAWPAPDRDAILQPPKPLIPPAERLLELTADHDRDLEAAD